MSENRYGNNVVQEMSSDTKIGYSGAIDCESMGYVGGQTGGQLWIRIYAHTALTIATGEYWYIEFQSYETDTVGSMDSPYSSDNAGGINQAEGTEELEGHYYLYWKDSNDGEAAWLAGDLIVEMAIPEKMLRLVGHKYVNIMNITDRGDVSETIDVLLCVNPS